MGSIVYAKEAAVLFTTDGPVTVAKGEAWDTNSAAVKANKNLFEDEPTRVQGRRVERATRAPGETRGPAPRGTRGKRAPSRTAAQKAEAAAKRKATAAAKKAAADKAKADEAAKAAEGSDSDGGE